MDRRLLEGNPYWSPELDARLGSFERERYVTLMPVALGKSQDYLGRVRWTLFGNSEQGPERAFWQSFYTAPKKEIPVSESLAFVSNLLSSVYGETTRTRGRFVAVGFPHFAGRARTNASRTGTSIRCRSGRGLSSSMMMRPPTTSVIC